MQYTGDRFFVSGSVCTLLCEAFVPWCLSGKKFRLLPLRHEDAKGHETILFRIFSSKLKLTRSRFFRSVFLLLFFAVSFPAAAQEPALFHYGVENGLPSSEVYDIIQDRKGYIWIATDRGVSRFDGYVFTNFTSQDGLTDNTVFNLQEDSRGRIWCITSNNRLCYFSHDSIIAYRYNEALLDHLDGGYRNLRSLNIDEQDNLVLGFIRNGFYKISTTGHVEKMKPPAEPACNFRYEVRVQNGRLLMATMFSTLKDGSAALNYSNGKAETVFPLTFTACADYLVGIARQNGDVVLGIGTELLEVSKSGKVRELHEQGNVIRLYEDPGHAFWVSVRGRGVVRYAPGQSPVEATPRAILAGKTVSCIYSDAEGGTWFGTLEHGIYYQPGNDVHTFFSSPSEKAERIMAIALGPKGRIFAGTLKGTVGLFEGDSLVDAYDFRRPGDSTNTIKALFYEEEKKELVASTENGIIRLPISERFKGPFSGNTHGGSIRVIAAAGMPHSAWAAGSGFVARLHFDAPELMPLDSIIHLPTRVDIVYEDARYGLLYGGVDGLHRLANGKAEEVVPGEPLLRARISGIVPLKGGVLALSTIGRGLLLLENGKVRQVSMEDGLPSNILDALAADENGTLWAGSNRGVSSIRIEGNKYIIKTYSTANGLPANEVRQLVAYGNRIWVGTTAGLAVFDPAQIKTQVLPPPVLLNRMEVNGKAATAQATGSLSYSENMIELFFTGLSFRSRGNILYRYRLGGSSDSWNYTRNTSVRFEKLPPGEYHFEVYAQDADGNWSAKPAEARFTILAPFWKTGWFIMLVILLVALLVGVFVQSRLRRIREKSLMQQRIVEFQQKALAAQMNPHFVFNSLNSIQSFILGDDKESVLKYLNRFSVLLRRSLENSMERYVCLHNELDVLRAYLDLESMRFKEKMEWSIHVEAGIDQKRIHVPAMLVQPYIENAVKHGLLNKTEGQGRLSVSFAMKNGLLLCTVDDNGIGREAAAQFRRAQKKEHRSVGTSITGERLALLCKAMGVDYFFEVTDKTDEQGRPAGLCVRFSIPFLTEEDATQSHYH